MTPDQFRNHVKTYSGDKLLRQLALARWSLDSDDHRRMALEAELELRLY